MRIPLTCLLAAALVLSGATASLAQSARTETVAAEKAAAGTVLEGSLRGEETVEYTVAAEAGQTLSVDLSTTNDSLTFNILPQGAAEALFIGSTSGNVADVPLPAAGPYVIQLALMRSAARRGETAAYALGIGLAGAEFADSLTGGPDWWAVTGLAAGSALNIRSGPAPRYAVVGKAQNGEVMQNRGCRMTGPDRWCSIRVSGSGVQGWVAGRFLTETAAPATPQGGPVGNGTPFDATGNVSCATAPEAPLRPCPFGVVREGPGNAGVWIALGDGTERQILFEGGDPVATNTDAPIKVEKTGDLFTITLGQERFQFPETVVTGG